MKSINKQKYIQILSILLLVAITISPAIAVATVNAAPGLKVVGALFMVDAEPGGRYEHEMIISTDSSDPPMDIVIQPSGFGQGLDGAYLALEPGEDKNPRTAATYIVNIDVPNFRLEPGDSKNVVATIEVPTDVGEGSRYAILQVAAEPITEDAGEPKQMVFGRAINVPIVVTIGPKNLLTKKGSITELKVSEIVYGKPLTILTTCKNTGNHHYKATNDIVVTDENGNIVAENATPLSNTSIVPPYSYQFKCPVPSQKGLPRGSYEVESRVVLEDGTLIDMKSTDFKLERPYEAIERGQQYAMNWTFVGMIMAAMVALGLGGIFIIRKTKRD